jgi:hypothetical protein
VSSDRFRHPRRQQTTTAWDTVRAAGSPRDCFADEIAIDFPSVDQLVDRVRERFLGEPDAGDTLTTEVWLSSRDATIGAVVPLEVPVRGTCPACGGRGETWTEPCLVCAGSGDQLVRRPVRLSVPPGVANGARFHFRVNSPDAASVRVQVRVAIV